jgi:transcriptional regulator with XRE-family HTH domain
MPHERLPISGSNRDLSARFARGLRDLLEKRGLSSRELCELVNAAGVKIDKRAVDHWLAGRRLPRLGDLERIGTALELDDYRDLLPEPLAKRRRRTG